MAGLLLTGKPGISAVVAGEVFYFYRCQRVFVKLAKSHHKCIQELPVEYNNSVYFMSPLTKILTSQLTISECSPVTAAKFQLSTNYWINTHSFTQVKTPKIFQSQQEFEKLHFEDLSKFNTLGLYTTEQIEATNRVLMAKRHHIEILNTIITKGTNNLADKSWNMQNMLSPAVHESILKNVIKQSWGVFAQIGNVLSGLLGFYFIFTIVRMALGHFITIYHVYHLVGCTKTLIFSAFPFFGRHLLYHHLRVGSQQQQELHTVNRTNESDIQSSRQSVLQPAATVCNEIRPRTDISTSSAPKSSTPFYPSVNMLSSNKHPMLQGLYVNGVQVSALVDTGASSTLINYNRFSGSFPISKTIVHHNYSPYKRFWSSITNSRHL